MKDFTVIPSPAQHLLLGEERTVPGSLSKKYLDRQEQRESNARSYPRRIPIAIREAKGIYVTDVDGRQYFDCLSGAGTLSLGHNHPVVKPFVLCSIVAYLYIPSI